MHACIHSAGSHEACRHCHQVWGQQKVLCLQLYLQHPWHSVAPHCVPPQALPAGEPLLRGQLRPFQPRERHGHRMFTCMQISCEYRMYLENKKATHKPKLHTRFQQAPATRRPWHRRGFSSSPPRQAAARLAAPLLGPCCKGGADIHMYILRSCMGTLISKLP